MAQPKQELVRAGGKEERGRDHRVYPELAVSMDGLDVGILPMERRLPVEKAEAEVRLYC